MISLKSFKRIISAVMVIVLLTAFIMPVRASADNPENKTVRIGWFDSSFCYYDKFGRRCGVDYEDHQKISA